MPTSERAGYRVGGSSLPKLSRAPPAPPTHVAHGIDRTGLPLCLRGRRSRSCPRSEKVVGSIPTGGSSPSPPPRHLHERRSVGAIPMLSFRTPALLRTPG